MARYNRINLDGQSNSYTAAVKTALGYGSVVNLDADGEFVEATGDKQLLILGGNYNQGDSTNGSLAAGQTGVAEYLVSGRKLAILADTGTYKVGDPVTTAGGTILAASTGTEVIGYAAEDATFTEEQLLAVFIK